MALPQKQEFYTYADLLGWETTARFELYEGEPVALASPSDEHQRLLGELFVQFRSFTEGKPCQVRFAPLDVRLFQGAEDRPDRVDTVVQPDLLVVCDRDKLDRHGVRGAPDFVLEITSPATRRYDLSYKFRLYQRAGVREYWIVDPEAKVIQTFVLENGRYMVQSFDQENGMAPVSIFDGLEIDLIAVFGPPEEETRDEP